MKMMSKPRYFSLEELLRSDTASKKHIDNTPSWEVVENLLDLALFLDGIREAWGSGIHINSGFRSVKLNAAVGGVVNSCHCLGLAADIRPSNGKMKEFEEFLVEYLKNVPFDTVIMETSKGTKWIHIQHYSKKGEQRRRIFDMVV